MTNNLIKAKSFSIVIAGYALSFTGSGFMLRYVYLENPLFSMAAADLLSTLIIFGFSRVFKNSSIYDPYWSLYPIFIGIWWFMAFGNSGNEIRNAIVLVLVVIWGIRLTHNWARGWQGLHHEDWRYKKLAKDTGAFYWLVSLLGIHLFPTVLVFLGCIPLYYIFQDNSAMGWFDILGMLIMGVSILIEYIADNQLREFRIKRTNHDFSEAVLKTGIWKYSRHPNYFGELLFWVGLFTFILNDYGEHNYYAISGTIAMIILFVFISIPMMEKREKAKEGYDIYQMETSVLIPWPPKRKTDG